MKTVYNGYELEITYKIESKYVYWLEIIVDNNITLVSKQYRLPEALKIFRWCIEDIPAHIMTDSFPNLVIYWGGIATGMWIKERINIQSVLDYINTQHKP